ncbi:hypothetical protein N7492_006758 [Penicillium capsulatum]|uniref:Ig-like domain-containing protein n=1 Tax=Penicillium capsulatum TaxID=69766 RepID=A0A9W9I0S1_9EURO|nr:hypothetical protein N7492_006758 [Penicillium capsulatum]KAJ6116594.1 hypothetical protein N7512_006319 [Penicillium capsulatum]
MKTRTISCLYLLVAILVFRKQSQLTLSRTDNTAYEPALPHFEPASPPTPSRWEAVFRTFGLGIIYASIKGQNGEYPKVAMWRSRSVALSKLLIHVIPFSAVLFLVGINIYGYWLGTEVPGIQGYNTAKLGALQFATKLHEITMLASLSIIIFTFVQRRIVAQQIAFGAMFAGLQYSNVSYLWSKELWGMIGSEWRRPYGKTFILVLLLATWLAPIVGPSSGVLMVPKIDDWPAGGTDFWLNTTRDKLWPSEVTDHGVNPGCLSDKDQSDCPFSGWRAFHAAVFPMFNHLTLPDDPYAWVQFPPTARVIGKYGLRSMNIFSTISFPLTVTGGLTSALADALSLAGSFWDQVCACEPRRKHFDWRKSAVWSIPDLQRPVTTVACRARSLSIEEGDVIHFPMIEWTPSDKPVPLPECFNVSNSQSLDRVIKGASGTHPDILWFPLADRKRGNHSLGAIVTIPPSPTGNGTLLSCTIDAHWVDGDYQVSHHRRYDQIWAPEVYFNASVSKTNSMIVLPRIHLSPRWAKYLNPRISNTNRTALEDLITVAGFWPTQPVSERAGRDLTSVVELSLSMMVSNGLSNLIPNIEIQGRRPVAMGCDPAWIDPLMPQKQAKGLGELGPGGMLWNMSGIDTANMTKFTMSVTVNGYAYSLGGATSIAAIIVLLIYCLLVIAHAVYVCFNSRSSSSWESISEIVALALQSRASDYLRNTGPGISTKDIFRSPVQIRDVGQRVQLTFPDTSDGSRMIQENKEYG